MARIPGCDNVEADKESHTFRRCTEWCLKKTLFTNACAKLSVTPDIDLFASRSITRSHLMSPIEQTQKLSLSMLFTCHGSITYFMLFHPLI